MLGSRSARSRFGSVMVVRALSPRSYGPETRFNLARHVYLDSAPILWWFTVMVSLFTMIITRIVIITAESYGLSQYALEMVIRVLVIELLELPVRRGAPGEARACYRPRASGTSPRHCWLPRYRPRRRSTTPCG